MTSSSSRHLLATIRCPVLRLDVLVGHAPVQDEHERQEKWWQEITAMIQGRPQPRAELVALIDANGRVGSIASQAAGENCCMTSWASVDCWRPTLSMAQVDARGCPPEDRKHGLICGLSAALALDAAASVAGVRPTHARRRCCGQSRTAVDHHLETMPNASVPRLRCVARNQWHSDYT